jgi:hypothetical protein
VTEVFSDVQNNLLGYFVVYIQGQRYGVYEPDATLLGNSIGTVRQRVANMGSHTLGISIDFPEKQLIDWYIKCYGDLLSPCRDILGDDGLKLWDEFNRNKILWAPDGDEAFDDGSHVFHFDFGRIVRLIGCTYVNYLPIENSIRSICLPSSDFYEILDRWQASFEQRT